MKFLILTVFIAICALSSSLPTKNEIHAEFITRLGKRLAILPPFDDPLRLNDTTVELDEDNIKGQVAIKDTVVNGLSSLQENLQLNLITLVFSDTVKLPYASASGKYRADVTGQIPGMTERMHLTGNGGFSGHIKNLNVRVGGRLKVKITGKVEVQNLSVSVVFQEFEANGENALLNGKPIDWAIVNPQIKPVFDDIFNKHNAEIVAAVQEIINTILGKYTLPELIEIITRPKP